MVWVWRNQVNLKQSTESRILFLCPGLSLFPKDIPKTRYLSSSSSFCSTNKYLSTCCESDTALGMRDTGGSQDPNSCPSKEKQNISKKTINILINHLFVCLDLNDKNEPALQRCQEWVSLSELVGRPKCGHELDTFKDLKKAKNMVRKDLILIIHRNNELTWGKSGSRKFS